MTSLRGRKVRVAGAGALGLSIAVELAGAGATVMVFDPDPEHSASSVAAGMLAPAFEAALDRASANRLPLLRAARDMWPAFAARFGIPVDRSGALYTGDRRAEIAAAFKAMGVSHRVDSTGVFTGEDLRLDAMDALNRLRAAATGLGVGFSSEPVTGPSGKSETVAATGWRTVSWAPESQAVSTIKGQILKSGEPPFSGPVQRRDAGYIAPSPGGALIGATMQPGEADLAPDGAMFDLLPKVLPPAMVAQAFSGQVQVGIRGATPDGLPLVGPSATPGVWLAMGARRNGWLLAPMVAMMIRSYLAGEDTGPWAGLMDARRFERRTFETTGTLQ